MKKNEQETELIITNEPTEIAGEKATATDGTGNTPTADSTDEGKEKPAARREQHRPGEDFKRQVLDNITEEDGPMPSGVTLIKVLGGEFFTAEIIRRQIWLVLLISVFAVIYISNRYSCQKSMVEINKLQEQLKDAKYKALSTSSELTEKSRESTVLEVLKQCGDSTIHVSDQPPYIIKVP